MVVKIYKVKYTDLRGNIITESEAFENGSYYKSYLSNGVVIKNKIVKDKEIVYIHYFFIEKDDLYECVNQHRNKYKNISACFHTKLEKENDDCYKDRMYLYSHGEVKKVEDSYSDSGGNEIRNITYKIEDHKLIPIFKIEYTIGEYGDVIEKCKKY